MSRLTGRTYGRPQKDDASSKTFDEVFCGKPSSSTKAASTIQRWGKASFTSTRGSAGQATSEGDSRKRRVEPTGQDSNDDPFSFDHEDEGPSKPKRGMGFKLKSDDLPISSSDAAVLNKHSAVVEKSVNKNGACDEIILEKKKIFSEQNSCSNKKQLEQKNGNSILLAEASAPKQFFPLQSAERNSHTVEEKCSRERKETIAVNDSIIPASKPRTAARLAAKRSLKEDARKGKEIFANGITKSVQTPEVQSEVIFAAVEEDVKRSEVKSSGIPKASMRQSMNTYARKIEQDGDKLAGGSNSSGTSLTKKDSYPRNRFFTSRGENCSDDAKGKYTDTEEMMKEEKDLVSADDDVVSEDAVEKVDDVKIGGDDDLWLYERDSLNNNGAGRMKIMKKGLSIVASSAKTVKDLPTVVSLSNPTEEFPIIAKPAESIKDTADDPWNCPSSEEEEVSFIRKSSSGVRRYGANHALASANKCSSTKVTDTEEPAIKVSAVKYTKVKDACVSSSSSAIRNIEMKQTKLTRIKDNVVGSNSSVVKEVADRGAGAAKDSAVNSCAVKLAAVDDTRLIDSSVSVPADTKCPRISRKPTEPPPSLFNDETKHANVSISIIATSSNSTSDHCPVSLPVKINLKGTLSLIEGKRTPDLSVVGRNGLTLSSATSSQEQSGSQRSQSSTGTVAVRRLLSGSKTVGCVLF